MPDLTEAYRRGIILDAYITDPKTIDYYQRTVTSMYGQVYNYTDQEMKKASDMRLAFFNDPVCSQLHSSSNLQEEVKNEGVDFNGLIYACSARCDGRLKQARWPWDLKLTSCATQGAFESVFENYDYDRQAFFYMEVCEVDRMMFIGVSAKAPYPIFKVMIMRGDNTWEVGKQKTIELIYKFDLLCQ